jgi:hypothetical protein
MGVEQTRRVLAGLVADGGARWMAEAVELVDMVTGEVHHGRAAAADWLARASPQGQLRAPTRMVLFADGGAAAAELQGRQGEETETLAMFCEVRGGEIILARVYRSRPTTRTAAAPAGGKSSGRPGS